MTYFQSLYFCYVSLLTIGYGDLSPTSNAGKPFFIVWSLIAVPTMTILISDMGDTVIASFKRGTFKLADWTVLPKAGIWREFYRAQSRLLQVIHKPQQKKRRNRADKHIAKGLRTDPSDKETAEKPEDDAEDFTATGISTTPKPTLDDVCNLDTLDDDALARKLAVEIRRTASEIKADPPKRYTYEEWAEFTRLIRFSKMDPEKLEEEEEEQGLVEWDWIGEDSPMLASKSESEWVLDRLCESLERFLKKRGGGNANGDRNGKGNGGSNDDAAAAAAAARGTEAGEARSKKEQ